MAVFESQISAQVTNGQKEDLGHVLLEDLREVPSTSEADVIRAAIELGLPRLREMTAVRRCEMYALHRRGLRLGAVAAD